MQLKLTSLIIALSLGTSAKDLGTVSTVLSIKEQSILEIIQQKLALMKSNGLLEKHQQEIQKKAIESVERPKPVEGISEATIYASKLYDPSIVMTQDIKDHQGKIIVLKGTRYNPLEESSFGEPLLFINGDRPEQVQWALSQKGKKILVEGAPLKLAREFKAHFYFDQGGVLVEKLGIQNVPAKVSQQGKSLLIETIPVSDKGAGK